MFLKNFYLNLTWYQYFIELKFKIFYTFLMYGFTVIICYNYKFQILYLLSKHILSNINSNKFFYNNITQLVYFYIEISCWISFLIIIPFIFFNFLSFFLNSFYFLDYIWMLKIYLYFLIIYIISILLCYFSIIPEFLSYFFNFEKNNYFFPLFFEANLENYIHMILKIFFEVLFLFQIPLIFNILIKIKILSNNFLIKYKDRLYFFLSLWFIFINNYELLTQIKYLILIIFYFEIIIFINTLQKYFYD